MTEEQALFKIRKTSDLNDLKIILDEIQTKEVCLAAVQQNGYALKYIKEQTNEVCIAAVQQEGYALEYVINQTPEICLAAVKQYGQAIAFVKDQTPKICIESVQQQGRFLSLVKKQTPEICLAALNQDPFSFELVQIVPNTDYNTTYKNLIELKEKEKQKKSLYNSL